MPNFSRAEIVASPADLSTYTTFLRRLSAGQVVTLPLEEGESARQVMRSLNAAAAQSGMRLARLAAGDQSVRFRIVRPSRARQVQGADTAPGSGDLGVPGPSEVPSQLTEGAPVTETEAEAQVQQPRQPQSRRRPRRRAAGAP